MANTPRLEIIIGAKSDQLKAALADLAQALNAVSRQADQAGAQTSGAFAGSEKQFGKTRAGVQSISGQLSLAEKSRSASSRCNTASV
jgi:ABC-type transporter Mla subunit MlaD